MPLQEPATKIISPRNPLLKDIRKALAHGTLTTNGCAVAESFHLLEEAVRSGCRIPLVLAAESVQTKVEQHLHGLQDVRLVVTSDAVFKQVATTESSQGVMALVEPPKWTLDALLRSRSLIVVLDGVQDPGNAGAIVRAAEAFGAGGALFLKGTVSPFNSKTLRAAAGSLFRLPVVAGLEPMAAKEALAEARLPVFAAVPRGGKPAHEIDWTRPAAIVIGGEGRGVSAALRASLPEVSVPTIGVESLNAAMAATVILYEAGRQRSLASSLTP